MDDSKQFRENCEQQVAEQGQNTDLRRLSNEWICAAAKHDYSYHFEWLGRPIIQHPQDMLAIQQILWDVQPNVVIETGIARGGSLIYSASLLELIAMWGGPPNAKVIGIDIDIRAHNRAAIEIHPLSKRIEMLQGSSIDTEIVDSVKSRIKPDDKVVVFLDSNHTHDHVLMELELYAPLVPKGSYCVVFDTIVEDMVDVDFSNRPWSKGDNPKTAVRAYLEQRNIRGGPQFVIDKAIENKLLITVAPGGFLKRV